MKNNYTTSLNLPQVDAGLLVLRLGVGALMLTHGVPKLIRLFSSEEITFGDPLGFGPEATLVFAVFAEFLCSILIMIGLGTRLAAIPLILTMSTAFFVAHAGDPFQRKELAAIYLVIFLVLLVIGSGKYSLDYYFLKKKRS